MKLLITFAYMLSVMGNTVSFCREDGNVYELEGNRPSSHEVILFMDTKGTEDPTDDIILDFVDISRI